MNVPRLGAAPNVSASTPGTVPPIGTSTSVPPPVGGATPHAADGSTPAAISMPAPMWDRMPASANEACVWPRPVYHERPPS